MNHSIISQYPKDYLTEGFPMGAPSCDWVEHHYKEGHYIGQIYWTPTEQAPYLPKDLPRPFVLPEGWVYSFVVGKANVFVRKDGNGFGCRVQYNTDKLKFGDEARWGKRRYSTAQNAMKAAGDLLLPTPPLLPFYAQ